MPNTGNTQQQINYGAAANDGQGDPLRTAFIKTDDNFDNVWLAGPVGSNITIGNNTIQSNNTNGNIVLKPNGTGIIQANASIIPNADNTRDLGSSSLAWRRAYIDELLPDSLTVSGDVTIGGNLTVQGDTIQIGNITTDTLTIQLANTAANAAAATGAGITVGANDDIATILYNSTANRWNVSVGMSAVGNISAPYFSGNGSLLTGIASYGNANVAANLAAFANNPISTTGNISANFFLGNGSQLTGLPATYGNANVVANLAALASNPVSTTGNVTGGNILTGGLISATGNISGNTAGFAIGYRDIPQVAFTANTTLAATDAGKHYYSTLATANTLTIANNTSVSWAVGTAITVVNRGSGNITIAQGTGVSLYLAGNSSAGNRTIATYGMATLLNVEANVWMINGSQVT